MPTTTTHAVLAAAAAKAFGEPDKTLRLWAATIAVSVLPDADTLGLALGVPYGDLFGHRGFFHSPCFALVLAMACATAFFRRRPLECNASVPLAGTRASRPRNRGRDAPDPAAGTAALQRKAGDNRSLHPLMRAWWKYVAFFFLVGASHGVLDAFTDGGLGIALLAPFSDARLFSPWRPIPVAPIGFEAAFGDWGQRVLWWEIAHLWLPAFALLAGFVIARGRLRRADAA